MLKIEEQADPKSCWNKAFPGERIFVLLGRDPAAGAAIRAWANERVGIGKNVPGDRQIREALECADLMAQERTADVWDPDI